MNPKLYLFLLRVAMGWLMLYAGLTKVIDSSWSAAGYLNAAKTFPAFYHWLAQPGLLPLINFINEWGLVLLGVSLILGIRVRITGIAGALLMLLYYFPVLEFPRIPPGHAYLIDEHIIYALALLYFAAVDAGKAWWGFDQRA